MRITEAYEPVVRTILSIDEENKRMTFAREMPKGALVRFVRAILDKIIDASAETAQNSIIDLESLSELAILVSCVGRKLVLGESTEEEVEAVREVFGDKAIIKGFYSSVKYHRKTQVLDVNYIIKQ